MFKCNKCDRVFESARALIGHGIAHKEGPRYKSRKKKPVNFYECKNCGVLCEESTTKYNLFCSNKCQQTFRWNNETKCRIEAGDTNVSTGTFKKYLRETVGDECVICGQGPQWFGKELVLQLDHKDGNSDNCSLQNLRLLCPNCHTQTDTFGSKGSGNRYRKITKRNIYLRDYKKDASVV